MGDTTPRNISYGVLRGVYERNEFLRNKYLSVYTSGVTKSSTENWPKPVYGGRLHV